MKGKAFFNFRTIPTLSHIKNYQGGHSLFSMDRINVVYVNDILHALTVLLLFLGRRQQRNYTMTQYRLLSSHHQFRQQTSLSSPHCSSYGNHDP